MTELRPLGSGTVESRKLFLFVGAHPWVQKRWITSGSLLTHGCGGSSILPLLPVRTTNQRAPGIYPRLPRTSRSTIRFLHIPEVVVFKICCSVVCSFVYFMFLSTMAFSLDTSSLCEAAYVSVLMVVFIVLAFVCKRKTWMWFGMTTASVFGVALIVVPVYLLKVQVSYYVCWYFMTALG